MIMNSLVSNWKTMYAKKSILKDMDDKANFVFRLRDRRDARSCEVVNCVLFFFFFYVPQRMNKFFFSKLCFYAQTENCLMESFWKNESGETSKTTKGLFNFLKQIQKQIFY